MTEIITRLMEANLLAVFDERDPQRRAAAIATTYAPDVQWIDDEGITTGHDELNTKAAELQEKLPGLHFVKAGPVRATRGLGVLAWESWPGRCAPPTTPPRYRVSTWPRSSMLTSPDCGRYSHRNR